MFYFLLDEGDLGTVLAHFEFMLEVELLGEMLGHCLEAIAQLLAHLWGEAGGFLHHVPATTLFVFHGGFIVVTGDDDFAAEYIGFEFSHCFDQFERSFDVQCFVVICF